MNDIVLSALLNLFALFGSKNGLDKESSLGLLSDYLVKFFGIRNIKSYVRLYSDLRDFYDDSPEMDKSVIVEGICTKLNERIRYEEKLSLLLRLMEFCQKNEGGFNPEDEIFRNVSDLFGFDNVIYGSMVSFISNEDNEYVKAADLDAEGDKLVTLFFKDQNFLLFKVYFNHSIWMDDIRLQQGVFQQWQQSSVLKSNHFNPVYYSTVLARYTGTADYEKVEMCGRDINFRFEQGGDNGMHNLSFTLASGELVAVMGGSGVGKSTLLSLLNGTLKPQSGSITINGHDINEPEAKALIGFVPQDDLLIEELTVYENLWYTAKLCFDRMPDDEIAAKVDSILFQLGLEAAKDLKVGSPINKFISGGQRKRLNIALELIREPAILFLDEPTSGLSSTDTEKVINLLKEQTYKGKLIIANIHQPSSDVYKLFDRLWLLDKGGYPIFDGNPIEAVSYFKSAANYADSLSSTCPTCGNVNPEIILNIVDEKAFDNTGHLSDQRKFSPQEWHEMYLKKRPEQKAVVEGKVPPTDQKRPGWFKQMRIFLSRNVSSKITNLQYVLVTLLEAPVLAAICGLLTHFTPDSGVYSLMENKNFPSYIFMAIIVAIFLGMSGSAEEIIRDRALLKREKFLNLSYGSYIMSKVIYMAAVCLIQTLLFVLVGNLIIEVHHMLWVWWLILFISAFLSSLIGLLLSQCMNSVVAIYITIPLLLIPQILLCGLVVKFEDLNPKSETGNVPVIGDIIPSRWAYEALAVANFTMNDYEKMIYEYDRSKYSSTYYVNGFIHELESQVEMKKEDVLRHELPFLAETLNLAEYSGDWSYDSLSEYLAEAKKVAIDISNKSTLKIDRLFSAFIAENGKEALVEIKRASQNLQLENLAVNRDTEVINRVKGCSIVPKAGYVFLSPRTKNGRAPFYSGIKILGNYEIDTVWYDIAVLLFMCILVGACLFSDFPGKLLRK